MVLSAPPLLERMMACPLEGHNGYYSVDFPAMGTRNRLIFRSPVPERARTFRTAAFEWLARFEQKYSVYIADSLISRINAAAGSSWTDIDRETEHIFSLVDWFHWRTSGAIDPTVGPLIALWDFRRQPVSRPDPAAVDAARERVGWARVERRPGAVRLPLAGMCIDLGGIGKEFAVDCVFKLAGDHGIRDVLVDLGRDIRVSGSPPEGGAWRIGLEHPDRPGTCWAGVALKDVALCASGTYQRYFDVDGTQYSHVIDPRTGEPVRTAAKAAWVIAPSATEAGALSTAALIAGAEEGIRQIGLTFGAEGCVWSGTTIHQTGRFAGYVLEESVATV